MDTKERMALITTVMVQTLMDVWHHTHDSATVRRVATDAGLCPCKPADRKLILRECNDRGKHFLDIIS